jgi:hypothetical protein
VPATCTCCPRSTEQVFGRIASRYQTASRVDELRVTHRVAAHAWAQVFGFDRADATTKRIPDLVFEVSQDLRSAFLRGYLAGDGCCHRRGAVTWSTSSRDVASGLSYLLAAYGVLASTNVREPSGSDAGVVNGQPVQQRATHYTLTVADRDSLQRLEEVWNSHKGGGYVRAALDRPRRRAQSLEASGDVVGLAVRAVRRVPARTERVYDFSVAEDENFVCGFGPTVRANTDADVDGAHIRTLALTLIFREMPELIEAGYVYIAKPPLYKIKQGSRERYIDKESELEEILLADKFEKLEVTDREGNAFKLTEARWQRFSRLLKQYEGWASSLRSGFGHDTIGFLEESGLLDEQVMTVEAAVEIIERVGIEGAPYETSLVDSDDDRIRVRAVETGSGLARVLPIRRALFDANDYRQFARVHGQLIELAGRPPFHVHLADAEDDALSFEALREAVLTVSRKGIGLQRFKGLGEMNASQLRETTMDPASRTLAQVAVEDAAAADRIFSMLMGDQVEPRREFIEDNARLVVNLDV